MTRDVSEASDPRGFAVLLHPHPDYGGNRFHPFVSSLFRQLPDNSVSAIRFDFSSSNTATAHGEVLAAIDDGTARWPGLRAVLFGYSFGAGIAAGVGDGRIAAWYLLAPQVPMLKDAVIRDDPGPKAVIVPEHDQFSPPSAVAGELSEWRNTTLSTAPGVDHFLGPVEPIVEHALGWVNSTAFG